MMEQITPVPVLLLKTMSKPVDRYAEVLSPSLTSTYSPVFIPVLEHGIIDDAVQEIEDLLTSGAFLASSEHRKYGGIIFTSQRAVEAFARVISSFIASSRRLACFLDDKTTLYVVGPGTSRALAAIDHLPCQIKGESTGNGDALAAFILDDYSANADHDYRQPLLFLVGEQRRDIIPRTLQSEELSDQNRIKVDEITVYKTVENPQFRHLFQAHWSPRQDTEQWVVIFSPSGCKTMLSVLGILDKSTGKFGGKLHPKTKVATIGPTTQNFLIREFGFTPCVCASNPTPEGLRDAIQAFDNKPIL